MRKLPLALLPILAGLVATAPGANAGALDQLIGTPEPSPAASAPAGPAPTATPKPTGPYFEGFTHEPGGEQGESVSLWIRGHLPDGKEPQYLWAVGVGKLSAATGGTVDWTGPVGKRGEPLAVPVTIVMTDGSKPQATGHLTITVDRNGHAAVTAVELPGLAGKPEDFEGGCFEAGTPVRLADGTQRAIEAVKVGDRVAAYDQDRGAPDVAEVQHVIALADHASSLTVVRTADGHELHATGNHPLMLADHTWKQVQDLRVGEAVLVWHGGVFEAVKIAAIVRDASRAGVVYNLKTTRHDYVAAEVLVHNKCLAAGSLVDTPRGPVAVERLRPGDRVFAADGRITRVTHTYAKRTLAAALPAKRLGPDVVATVNHLVAVGRVFRPAGELPFPDALATGTVYDLDTEAGSYRAGGFAMTAGVAPALAAV